MVGLAQPLVAASGVGRCQQARLPRWTCPIVCPTVQHTFPGDCYFFSASHVMPPTLMPPRMLSNT